MDIIQIDGHDGIQLRLDASEALMLAYALRNADGNMLGKASLSHLEATQLMLFNTAALLELAAFAVANAETSRESRPLTSWRREEWNRPLVSGYLLKWADDEAAAECRPEKESSAPVAGRVEVKQPADGGRDGRGGRVRRRNRHEWAQ